MKPTLFVFLRHAESEKNISETVGGKGKKLTPLGIQQSEEVAQRLFRSLGTGACNIISSHAVQAVETADIIAKHFCSTTEVSNALGPANMGVISGLKEADIQMHFPELSEIFQKWRAGEIEACDLTIPGREPPEAFWERMLAFLNHRAEGGVNIIVTTRSLMVFAKNLVRNNHPRKGGGYKHMDVDHCEIVSFIWDNGVHAVVPVEGWETACNE